MLCATTTLAAGVNLPARRVILPEPTDHDKQLLRAVDYRQMAGRAGRAGLCDLGEVFVIARSEAQRTEVVGLMASPMARLTSLLLGRRPPPKKAAAAAADGSQLPPPPVAVAAQPASSPRWLHPTACQRFLLEAVASGLASTPAELEVLTEQASPPHISL